MNDVDTPPHISVCREMNELLLLQLCYAIGHTCTFCRSALGLFVDPFISNFYFVVQLPASPIMKAVRMSGCMPDLPQQCNKSLIWWNCITNVLLICMKRQVASLTRYIMWLVPCELIAGRIRIINNWYGFVWNYHHRLNCHYREFILNCSRRVWKMSWLNQNLIYDYYNGNYFKN